MISNIAREFTNQSSFKNFASLNPNGSLALTKADMRDIRRAKRKPMSRGKKIALGVGLGTAGLAGLGAAGYFLGPKVGVNFVKEGVDKGISGVKGLFKGKPTESLTKGSSYATRDVTANKELARRANEAAAENFVAKANLNKVASNPLTQSFPTFGSTNTSTNQIQSTLEKAMTTPTKEVIPSFANSEVTNPSKAVFNTLRDNNKINLSSKLNYAISHPGVDSVLTQSQAQQLVDKGLTFEKLAQLEKAGKIIPTPSVSGTVTKYIPNNAVKTVVEAPNTFGGKLGTAADKAVNWTKGAAKDAGEWIVDKTGKVSKSNWALNRFGAD